MKSVRVDPKHKDGVVEHGAEFVRQHYLDTCAAADKLPGDSKKDARMREMFLLNLRWFMATLLEGSVANGYGGAAA